MNLDLPGFEDKDKNGEPTGIALPYVVTLNQSTGDILSIYRNWREDDKLKLKRQHFVHYQYVPGYGAYGFGLFHLVGGFAKSATSIMRQLVDAGTLSNLPGGLKSRGLRIKGDDTPIAPGEFRDVDVGSGSIRDNILPLPYKEPSATLYNLLNTIVEEGRRFAATADMKISDMSAQAPVGTTLALLERQLKVMTAVQARVHYALKQEFRLIAGLVRDNSPHDYDYDVKSEYGRRAKYEDYRHTDIIPVSDPNAATLSQRVVQYQAVMQMAQQAPQIYNLPQLHRRLVRHDQAHQEADQAHDRERHRPALLHLLQAVPPTELPRPPRQTHERLPPWCPRQSSSDIGLEASPSPRRMSNLEEHQRNDG